MQALATVTTVFAFVAIAIHVYIWIIESFLWTKPKGRETFGMTEEFAESTKEMAANQGLYNLMLAWIAATGLLAFWFGSPQVAWRSCSQVWAPWRLPVPTCSSPLRISASRR